MRSACEEEGVAVSGYTVVAALDARANVVAVAREVDGADLEEFHNGGVTVLCAVALPNGVFGVGDLCHGPTRER
jgi:hypothetical protein